MKIMIKSLFKQQKTIGGAAALMGFFTILAQVLAILKNKLLAVHFGASSSLDIFYAAFKIPDLIFLLVGTMATGSILLPIFTDKENISIEEKEKFMTRFLNSFSILLIGISLIVFFLIPFLIEKIFPAFIGEKKELLINISRLFLLSPIFMGIANFFGSVNQRNKIFLPLALTGVLYNLTIILGIIFLSPSFGLYGLAFSVVIAAFMFLLIQFPSIIKWKLFKLKREFLDWEELKVVFKKAIPRSFALSISAFIILYFYSKISHINQDGLIVIFTFAFTIFNLPINLINSSYSSAMLPVISKFYSQSKIDEFNRVIREVISRVFFLIIPIGFFVASFSDLIIGAFFSSQKFNLEDINSSGILLMFFALMIPFQVLLTLISKIFYSMGETKPVMWVNIFAGVMAIVLLNIFDKTDLDIFSGNTVDHFGELLSLTLIFIFSYILASIFLIVKLRKKIKGIIIFNHKRLISKILISLISIILTKLIFIFLQVKVSLYFAENIKNFVIFGLLFVVFVLVFSEIFKEKNYLEFKEKILRKIKS